MGRQSEAVCSGYDYDVIESVSTDSNGIAQFSMLHNDGTRTNVSVLQAIHIIMSEVVSLIESVYPTASHPHQHYVIGVAIYLPSYVDSVLLECRAGEALSSGDSENGGERCYLCV